MSYLIHAITRPAPGPAGRGLRGAPLELIEAGALGAWASVDPAEGSSGEDALDHHRVVEALCAARPCLPVRFGTRLPDAAAVRALLQRRADELADALDRVGARREVAVTLLWPDAGPATVQAGTDQTEPAGAPPPPAPGHAVAPAPGALPPGRAFLERKRADHADLDARRAVAEALARRLEAELATDQADVRHAVCPSSQVALSTAILARAGEADALKERAVEIVSRLAGVRGVVSGPWPPYTFAGTA